MLEKIISILGVNFKEEDNTLLQTIIDEATTNALSISNRKNTTENLKLLESEIVNYTIGKYLQRGTEDTASLSESGKSAKFKNLEEEMKKSIVSNGKRLLCK